jgi:hypothetical protein
LPVKPEEPALPDEEPSKASDAPQEPADGAGGEPVFDDALAQQIEAQVAAERQAAFDEPALDGVWDETQGSK